MITADSIKLLESERMSDTTDGGGRRTSRVIPDGVAGNIFPKVSRLDSVYGRVNLRKVYGAVQTDDLDVYAGSHAILTDAPDNSRIHVTLFSTGSDFDTRTEARDRIESYVASGPESRMVLFGRQLAGQQGILCYQREEEPLPEVGEVFCLSKEAGTTVLAQQYFRIQSIDHEVRTFTDSVGSSASDFRRRVLSIGTGVPLRYEFTGPETPSRYSNVARDSKIRNTTVVDAARYFGIQKLSEASPAESLDVKVQSVYTPIVPTTNRETPVSSATINGALDTIAAKATTVSEVIMASWSAGTPTAITRRAIKPGSLTLSGSGMTAATDDGLGNFTSSSFVGTVDYAAGIITRTGGTAGGANITATYVPAATPSQPAHTRDIPITLGNRGTVYTQTFNPLPAPGTLIVDYRALGKWYRLRDDGKGSVKGSDSAYGVGSIDYVTGALVLTLGALPDVSSSLIFAWGSPIHFSVRADATSNAGGKVVQIITLPDTPIAADSVAVSYVSGGVTYTGGDNSAGVITGNGLSGSVNYTTGELKLEYTTRLPDVDGVVAVSYQQLVPTVPGQVVVNSLTKEAAATVELGGAVDPGSFNASIPFAGQYASGNVVVVDNGLGLLIIKGGQLLTGNSAKGAVVAADQAVGSINYDTGTVTINGSAIAKAAVYTPPERTLVSQMHV